MGSLFKNDADDLGDDIAAFFDKDGVIDADIFLGEFIEIVQGSAGDGGTCELDGIEIGNMDVADEKGNISNQPSIQLGTPHLATIMVLDDDHGGLFQLDSHEMEITESVGVLELKVNRQSGARGKVAIPFTTEEGTAKAGKDFEHVEGEEVRRSFDEDRVSFARKPAQNQVESM